MEPKQTEKGQNQDQQDKKRKNQSKTKWNKVKQIEKKEQIGGTVRGILLFQLFASKVISFCSIETPRLFVSDSFKTSFRF